MATTSVAVVDTSENKSVERCVRCWFPQSSEEHKIKCLQRCVYCWFAQSSEEHKIKCLDGKIECTYCYKEMSRNELINKHYEICSNRYLSALNCFDLMMGTDEVNRVLKEIENRPELDYERRYFVLPYKREITKVVLAVDKLRAEFNEAMRLGRDSLEYPDSER
jgi:hypothetical protein